MQYDFCPVCQHFCNQEVACDQCGHRAAGTPAAVASSGCLAACLGAGLFLAGVALGLLLHWTARP